MPRPALHGCDKKNICNHSKSRRGIQLEFSKGSRRSFFESLSGRRTCRRKSKEAAKTAFAATEQERTNADRTSKETSAKEGKAKKCGKNRSREKSFAIK